MRVELVKAMEGEVVAVLDTPVLPQGTVTLKWGDESVEWHVEGVVDMETRLNAASGDYELVLVRVAVTRSRFGGGAVKV